LRRRVADGEAQREQGKGEASHHDSPKTFIARTWSANDGVASLAYAPGILLRRHHKGVDGRDKPALTSTMSHP
jgi:hypothetical protein